MHGGYGASIAGHGHPAIVEAVSARVRRGTHFAQPTEDAIWVAGELARRFGLPLWRFANSGTEATMDAIHLMRAADRARPDHQGRGLLPRPPRLGAGLGAPRGRRGRPRGRPNRVPGNTGIPPRSWTSSSSCRSTTSPPWRGRSPSTAGRIAGDDPRAGDDERRHHPARRRLPRRPPRPAARRGRAAHLRRGEDRVHHRPRRRHRRSGVVPDIVCLAKALGGGIPVAAIGGTET